LAQVPPLDHDDCLAEIQIALRAQNPFALARRLLSFSSHPSNPVSAILLRLPTTAFSALLQTLDPLRCGPEIDPAWEINIPAGLQQYSHVAQLNNRYGVRHLHLALFPVLLAAFRARLRHCPVIADDYKILLRCAGACQDVYAVRTVWKLMDRYGHVHWRTTELFTEFIQARFFTLPPYYQFDRLRVRLRPGDLYRSTTALPANVRKRLDHLRLSLNLHRWRQYGILTHGPSGPPSTDEGSDAGALDGSAAGGWHQTADLSVSRLLRAQGPVNRVWCHVLKYGVAVDEKLFCAILIAWSRTGARRMMKMLLHRYYGIRILENWDIKGFKVVMNGARRFYEDSLRRPTEALLHAVVDAFGTTGDIRIGINLALHIAHHWNVPITHAVWSSMLRWAYLSGTKPFSTEWNIVRSAKPQWRSGALDESRTQAVWDAMMASPDRIEPTWDDISIYIKAAINSNDLGLALDMMLEARAKYDALLVETTHAFHAMKEHGAFMGESSAAMERLHFEWQRCRFWLDLARNDMRLWVKSWLKKHSKHRVVRENAHETTRLIPRMALAFRGWLPFPMKYRTATGHVTLFVQGDPTFTLDRVGDRVVSEVHQNAAQMKHDGQMRRAEKASLFATQLQDKLAQHRSSRPAGRTVAPGQEVPLVKTVFFKPPPTSLRLVSGGRANVPGKGRKTSVLVQPWIRRKMRMPWVSPAAREDADAQYGPPATRETGRIWLEPVLSGDVEEDMALKPASWTRMQRLGSGGGI
jgi:hypothetical protein